ncbi:hypothetical protein [Cupriavidus pinatubonensis]|uniref:Uncharacterized protein n=1 Tax=Cupriavidus pinatubonensis TaxID=248026 RepID=A0ABM8Y3N0_9BURK|nr:hypothetical protein [Cupriavidus pinatubonensis]CAG9187372.1 hypothetical protein LMG23994_06817 [Cupriavidus pinatubonensis]
MLSPHEIAKLLLLQETTEVEELDPADLGALVERQLVTLEKRSSSHVRPRLTSRGDALLKAVSRFR